MSSVIIWSARCLEKSRISAEQSNEPVFVGKVEIGNQAYKYLGNALPLLRVLV